MRFIPAVHSLLNKTVHGLGMDVVDFQPGYGAGGRPRYYLRGKHMTYEDLIAEAPYNMPPENRIDLDNLYWNVFKNFTISSQDENDLKSLDGVKLSEQSQELYYNKYLDKETSQFLVDSANFISEYGPHLAAVNYIPVSDPSLSSAPEAVKTVAEGFQAIPEGLVDQFLKASDKHKFFRNHHLNAINKHKDGKYILTFQLTETKAGITTDFTGACQFSLPWQLHFNADLIFTETFQRCMHENNDFEYLSLRKSKLNPSPKHNVWGWGLAFM